MEATFAVSTFNRDISNWDVSSVTNMLFMFYAAEYFNQDIGSWDVSNVTTMFGMFRNAQDFSQNLGHWNISNVTEIKSIFQSSNMSCENYSRTLRGWATNSATPSNLDLGILSNSQRLPLEYSADVIDNRDYLIHTKGWIIEGDTQGSCLLAVDSFDNASIVVYPNPAKDRIFIEGLTGNQHIELYDISGREILSETFINMNSEILLNHLPYGVFFVKIKSTDGHSIIKKIIKKE